MTVLQEGQYILTAEQAVQMLDAIVPGDNEAVHGQADSILLSAVDAEVREAFRRAEVRVGGFWYS